MKKEKLNYFIDLVLIVLVLIVMISGFVLKFVFVSGEPGVGRTVEFLGTDKMNWLPWHTLAGISFSIFMVFHLVLHFDWIGTQTKNLFKKNKN